MKKSYEKFWSLKRIFELPRLSTLNICKIGLLIAITFVLSAISGYLRIGNISKLSLSFASVFVSAVSYGGMAGGFVGAAADIISFLMNPISGFIPQLTLIEFAYGLLFGVLFYKTSTSKYYIYVLIYDAIQLVINIFVKSAILSSCFGMSYMPLIISRLPMCIIQAIIVAVVLIFIKPFTKSLR